MTYMEYLNSVDIDDTAPALKSNSKIDALSIWMHVISLAVQDFYYDGSVEELDEARMDAVEWLLVDSDLSNSFNNVAKLCGMNIEMVRHALLKNNSYDQFKSYIVNEYDLAANLDKVNIGDYLKEDSE